MAPVSAQKAAYSGRRKRVFHGAEVCRLLKEPDPINDAENIETESERKHSVVRIGGQF